MASKAGVASEEAFAAFVRAREGALLRLAWALTGDLHTGQDLAQTALARLWPRWSSVADTGDPWPYLQRIVISLAVSWHRRRWRAELPFGALPADRSADDEKADSDDPLDDLTVRGWLAALPVRQRAVIVLRFLCDLSVEQTAAMLGCSTGTVSSQTFKARARLRALLDAERQTEAEISRER